MGATDPKLDTRTSPDQQWSGLAELGPAVNDAFFLGGIDEGAVMKIFRPHIFFDDQVDSSRQHRPDTAERHILFGQLSEVTLDTM